ncbi:efflux RND transporter periplasmic adaptor subunit [Mangrovimicrobium sediminis]|uniref:Efflux RND transporter periplasmic adaptor subunit n=1 Tax=Mangrovimicrobium sediminis TaxID=2562682 RepID=A0A4Z0LX40_9GAMM|nr:efflux RND transporter periplasmic adaptor subunit [Haliea sp. SAOS-164]TGD71849.1 efflux RND transporter periplasmic adaptor subunit [Haliea sp. SAOS-164]
MKRCVPVVALLFLLVACSGEQPPPREVQVVVDTVVEEPYQPKREYVGRLQARDDVAIQARVSGYLTTREFDEGQVVQAGQVLYTIDSSEYDAALARARAELAAAVAVQSNAERNFRRGKELLPKGAISQAEMDNLTATKLDADARLKSAEAQVTSAEVNLSYTTITAPITGRIGRSIASVGDLVGPNSGNLTTLVSIDPIEALFQVSETTYLATLGADLTRDIDVERLRALEVTLELANGVSYPEVGYMDYFSNRVDAETGTLEARAAIPNPHALLVPGQYVRVILQRTTLVEGLFVPQAAVQVDQQGSYVLTVEEGSVVVRHNVELGERMDQLVRVHGGVAAGDQVIVRGLQLVRPGMTVTARSVDGPAAAPATPPAQ